MGQVEKKYQDNRFKYNHINNNIKIYGLNTPVKSRC